MIMDDEQGFPHLWNNNCCCWTNVGWWPSIIGLWWIAAEVVESYSWNFKEHEPNHFDSDFWPEVILKLHLNFGSIPVHDCIVQCPSGRVLRSIPFGFQFPLHLECHYVARTLPDASRSKVASGVNMCACLKHRIPNEPQQGPQLECIVHVFFEFADAFVWNQVVSTMFLGCQHSKQSRISNVKQVDKWK